MIHTHSTADNQPSKNMINTPHVAAVKRDYFDVDTPHCRCKDILRM